MSSTGWKVGDVYQINGLCGLIGDLCLEDVYNREGDFAGADPIFKGNLTTSDPEYLIGLLGLEEDE
jgi:hypothetical protein